VQACATTATGASGSCGSTTPTGTSSLLSSLTWSIRYVPLQSESGRKLLQRSGRSPDDISSVVLVEKERSYIKSEAVLRIMEYLNLPFPQLAIFLKFVPLFLRDFAYDNVANNRYTVFGRSETEACEIL